MPNHRGKVDVTPEMAAQMKTMREAGMAYKHIGQHFGVTLNTVKAHIIPEFRERRRQMDAERYERIKRFGKSNLDNPDWEAEQRWRRELPRMPKGPKSWNQALLGDPLEGRSALDQRSNA